MQKIDLELFIEYSFLSSLTPYGAKLLFNEFKQNIKDNDYDVRIHQLDPVTEEDVVLTDWSKQASFVVLDDVLYFTKFDKDAGHTHFTDYKTGQICFSIPLQVLDIKVFNADKLLVLALIDTRYPDKHKMTIAEKAEVTRKAREDEDYLIFDEYPFFFNGLGIINYQRHGLFLVDKKTNEVTRLTSATMNVASFDFKEDKVVFSGIDYESFMGKWSKVYEIDTKDNSVKTLFDGDDMQIQHVFYSEKAVTVVGTFGKDYGAMEASKFYELVDGKMELVFDSEHSLYNSVGSDCRYGRLKNFLKHDNVAYFITTIGSNSVVLKYESKRLETYLDNIGSTDDMCFIGEDIYTIAMRGQKLQEVYDKDGKALTSLNEDVLKGRYVAKPINVKVDKPVPIEGWVLLPEDYDTSKTYPAILDIHGGPKTAYGEIFYHEMQYWASCGYIVMYCNPRGSDGYGNAFADLRRNFGKIDYEDIMDFVDKVCADFAVDKERLGVTGGSYGGYMTNWIIGHTDRFKAAASQRSISNWISMVCASDYGIDFPIEQEYADLYNCQEELWDMSPLKYANNAKTPTLFIHSTEDYRCPIPEGIQMYTVLKCRGVPSKLVGFIGENHELSRSGKPHHRIRRLKEISEWLFKYIG